MLLDLAVTILRESEPQEGCEKGCKTVKPRKKLDLGSYHWVKKKRMGRNQMIVRNVLNLLYRQSIAFVDDVCFVADLKS